MAVIKDLRSGSLTRNQSDNIRDEIASEMWKWYEANKGTKVTTIKKWFFSFTIKVKHLRPLFVLLFGEPK